MRLYSRGQVIFFSVVSAVGVLALAVIFGLVRLPDSRTASIPQAQPINVPAASDSAVTPALQTPSAQSKDLLTVDSATNYSEGELTNIEIYQRLNPAVVNITTETVGLNWFLEPVPQGGGVGSGSIIDPRGYVLTNYHVV